MEVRVKSEKEELLDKKIEEVRKRNEARLKKFQEAEEDRRRAEEAGCAVDMKKSTFDDDDYFPAKQRGQHHKAQPYKSGSHKNKKYMPGTSDEWKEYIAAKNRSNGERGSYEENNNDSSFNENSNNNNSNSFNNSRRERIPKGNMRAIYIPKQLQNRDSPENVKPPPPDPRNSFLADSYRHPTSRSKPDDLQPDHVNLPAKVEDQRPFEPRKQQVPSPMTPAGSQGTFHGDARQRINQLKALRNQDQPSASNESANLKHNLNQVRHEMHRPPYGYNKSGADHFKAHSGFNSPANGRTPRDVKAKEAVEKPIKSILKRPKQPNVAELDDSQPIIAVITTPGDDDEAYEDEVAQGYNKKKEEAICDWLKKSKFDDEEGNDDDEWEDVDDDEDGAVNHQEPPVEEKAVDNPDSAPVATATSAKMGDEDLEAFEEDNAAFQEFIAQHTLTLEKDGGFNWATEMERLSLENKQKIDLEAVEKLISND